MLHSVSRLFSKTREGTSCTAGSAPELSHRRGSGVKKLDVNDPQPLKKTVVLCFGRGVAANQPLGASVPAIHFLKFEEKVAPNPHEFARFHVPPAEQDSGEGGGTINRTSKICKIVRQTRISRKKSACACRAVC